MQQYFLIGHQVSDLEKTTGYITPHIFTLIYTIDRKDFYNLYLITYTNLQATYMYVVTLHVGL